MSRHTSQTWTLFQMQAVLPTVLLLLLRSVATCFYCFWFGSCCSCFFFFFVCVCAHVLWMSRRNRNRIDLQRVERPKEKPKTDSLTRNSKMKSMGNFFIKQQWAVIFVMISEIVQTWFWIYECIWLYFLVLLVLANTLLVLLLLLRCVRVCGNSKLQE